MPKKTKRKRSRRIQQYEVIYQAVRRAMRRRREKQTDSEQSA